MHISHSRSLCQNGSHGLAGRCRHDDVVQLGAPRPVLSWGGADSTRSHILSNLSLAATALHIRSILCTVWHSMLAVWQGR